MPQRQRPRLKQYAFACDWCGASTVKLYPSRESVRRKLSPYRFCSSTCQRDHWEARRKAEWSGVPYPCAQCGTAITPQQAAGRRRSYCNDTCKAKAARERRRRNPAGAVMAARQQFKEAWHDAVKAAHEFVEIDLHGAPVGAAFRRAQDVKEATIVRLEAERDEVPLDLVYAQSEVKIAINDIRYALDRLRVPRLMGEPDRQKLARLNGNEWFAWWNWFSASRNQCKNAYEHYLQVAKAAKEELRKKERVAARRAETARIRRSADGQDRDTAGRTQRIPEASER